MKVAESTDELRRLLTPVRANSRIALAPTMGCLHAGHASLISKARQLADVVVVSIYVNPLQFGPKEDLGRYPRTFEADRALCEMEGADIIFHPASLYSEAGPGVTLTVSGLARCLCGAHRPGHFDGVATAVNILFNIVQPDIAVFGEKDWQQLVIIRRMVSDLCIPVDCVSCPTVRESDGLARSSRNRYLSPGERQRAGLLYASLRFIAENAKKGEKNCKKLCKQAENRLKTEKIDPEYLDIRDAASLSTVDRITHAPARAFVAARIGKARLIDNIALETP